MEHIGSAIIGQIVRRQNGDCVIREDGFYDEEACDVPFWYTKTGTIVKWSLFLSFTALFTLYLVLGYLHAKSRLKKGLPPLAYHRWLVSRRDLARVDPRYQLPPPNAYTYHQHDPNGGQPMYGMHAMPPPPVYDPSAPRPPVYDGPGMAPPPPGATKIDPDQHQQHQQPSSTTPRPEAAPEYEASSGPPPATMMTPTVAAQNTGSTNPFRA